MSWELPLPSMFEDATETVTEEQVAEEIVCGPDARRHIEKIKKYVDAGIDHVCIHQIGPDQEGFMRFYAREVMPEFGKRRAAA